MKTKSPSLASRFRGCLLGLAVGDAIGTTVEFMSRGSFEPLTDMVGGGPFHLPVGAWTDDTSMALCLADSLIEHRGFSAHDQMKRYLDWWRHGFRSSTGKCFDIGQTTARALRHFEANGNPFSGSTDLNTSGNGSLMRLAPIPMFYLGRGLPAAIAAAQDSSRTTHGSVLCLDACRLLCDLIFAALSGNSKHDLLFEDDYFDFLEVKPLAPKIQGIFKGDYREKTIDQISGSGYVVDCLEAACWCFLKTDNFRDAVLLAANLGDDADTTAAVVGQLAGAYYGEDGIPREWLMNLVMAEEIGALADRLRTTVHAA